ncbi:MAG TPA: response regulator, partial [Myxococcaceae bacterium]|nr:response regulator [Myxococcaceae bacterium]
MSMETVQDVESMEGLRELLEREQLPPQVAQRRVLVVEDDPAQREFLVTLLADWGYEPMAVGSAEEAEFSVRRRTVDAA